jgi:hypothetical protein
MIRPSSPFFPFVKTVATVTPLWHVADAGLDAISGTADILTGVRRTTEEFDIS